MTDLEMKLLDAIEAILRRSHEATRRHRKELNEEIREQSRAARESYDAGRLDGFEAGRDGGGW